MSHTPALITAMGSGLAVGILLLERATQFSLPGAILTLLLMYAILYRPQRGDR